MGLGILFRAVAVVQAWPGYDGSYYVAMARSFADGKEFLLPFGSVFQGRGLDPVLAQHQAPLWPMILSSTYRIAGFSLEATSVTSFIVGIFVVLTAFLATKDLLGHEKAWFVAALVSLDYFLIQTTARAYSENLVAIFYIATIWAILRSLKDDRFIIFAGLFAGVGYLSKASIGYFFLLAGTMGFLWRFYYMRWKVLRERSYLVAIAVFFGFVSYWAVRNIGAFGWPHWETSPYTNEAIVYAAMRPIQLVPILGLKVLLFAAFYSIVSFFFFSRLRIEIRQWKEEAVSAHSLAILLPGLLGLIFAASFAVYERWPTAAWSDNLRYVSVAFVPMIWLGLRHGSLPEMIAVESRWTSLRNSIRRILHPRFNVIRVPLLAAAVASFFLVDHMVGLVMLIGAAFGSVSGELRPRTLVCLLLAFALAGLNSATTSYRPPEYYVGQYISEALPAGVTVAIDGNINVYYMAPFLSDRQVQFVYWNGTWTEYLLADHPTTYPEYALVASFNWTSGQGLFDRMYSEVNAAIRNFAGVSRLTPSHMADLYFYKLQLP